jgi:hypothetical protein
MSFNRCPTSGVPNPGTPEPLNPETWIAPPGVPEPKRRRRPLGIRETGPTRAEGASAAALQKKEARPARCGGEPASRRRTIWSAANRQTGGEPLGVRRQSGRWAAKQREGASRRDGEERTQGCRNEASTPLWIELGDGRQIFAESRYLDNSHAWKNPIARGAIARPDGTPEPRNPELGTGNSELGTGTPEPLPVQGFRGIGGRPGNRNSL